MVDYPRSTDNLQEDSARITQLIAGALSEEAAEIPYPLLIVDREYLAAGIAQLAEWSHRHTFAQHTRCGNPDLRPIVTGIRSRGPRPERVRSEVPTGIHPLMQDPHDIAAGHPS
ncbi:hypothetical protein [uncultured Dietzia sp.]|uniref:hypothetical protein n=1 Tax=uncultured Dietzia sp. TaxID=395519 RepID=UPI0025EC9496|nr:hypothetical protein [uncultured Dietzia sp.]